MISPRTRTKEWIENLEGKYDSGLAERMIMAFILVEDLQHHIYEGSFTPEDAIVAGSKIAYLSALTLIHSPKFCRFDRKADLSSLHINTRDDFQRLERLKKSSIEAFYYYFQTLELFRNI